MYGISIKLPVTVLKRETPSTTKSITDNTQQNLKNLLLTAPGEKVMDPSFGVGLRNFLFENNTAVVAAKVESRIRSQISKYMPFVNITSLQVMSDQQNNLLDIYLRYDIQNIASDEILNLSIDPNFTS